MIRTLAPMAPVNVPKRMIDYARKPNTFRSGSAALGVQQPPAQQASVVTNCSADVDVASTRQARARFLEQCGKGTAQWKKYFTGREEGDHSVIKFELAFIHPHQANFQGQKVRSIHSSRQKVWTAFNNYIPVGRDENNVEPVYAGVVDKHADTDNNTTGSLVPRGTVICISGMRTTNHTGYDVVHCFDRLGWAMPDTISNGDGVTFRQDRASIPDLPDNKIVATTIPLTTAKYGSVRGFENVMRWFGQNAASIHAGNPPSDKDNFGRDGMGTTAMKRCKEFLTKVIAFGIPDAKSPAAIDITKATEDFVDFAMSQYPKQVVAVLNMIRVPTNTLDLLDKREEFKRKITLDKNAADDKEYKADKRDTAEQVAQIFGTLMTFAYLCGARDGEEHRDWMSSHCIGLATTTTQHGGQLDFFARTPGAS